MLIRLVQRQKSSGWPSIVFSQPKPTPLLRSTNFFLFHTIQIFSEIIWVNKQYFGKKAVMLLCLAIKEQM